MIRIFVPPEQITKDEALIRGDEARHLTLVLRVQPGEIISILDGQGNRYECSIQQVHKKEVKVRILKKITYSAESPISITLAQGIPKGDKMDFIIQKATELGVSKIIPLITERTQVRYTQKIDRWKKIAVSASQQSDRERIPEISELISFTTFIEEKNSSSLKLIFSEDREGHSFKRVLNTTKHVKDIVLLIGPEGGFSQKEIAMATKRGYIKISLGPRIMRTETAPIAAISIIQYELGDMG